MKSVSFDILTLMVNQDSTNPSEPQVPIDETQNFYTAEQDEVQMDSAENTSESLVSWEASEFISNVKSPLWHVAFIGTGFIVSLLLVAIMRDIFAGIMVFIMFGLTYYVAMREPRTLRYEINDEGVIIGDKQHPYELFHSFSVMQEGALDSIQFNPLQRLSLPIVIYFAPDDARAIFDAISRYLPHEQKETSPIDKFSRRMRF